MQALAQGWPDETTRTLLTDRATTDDAPGRVRQTAVQALAQGWPDEATRTLLTDRATTDEHRVRPAGRGAGAGRGLARRSHPYLAHRRATTDTNDAVRRTAVQALAQGWPDEAHPHPAHRSRHHRQSPGRPADRGAGARPGLARRGTPAPCSPTAPPPTPTRSSGRRRCRPSPRAGPTRTTRTCSPTAPPPTPAEPSGRRRCRRSPRAGPTRPPVPCSPNAPPPTPTRPSGGRRCRPLPRAGPTRHTRTWLTERATTDANDAVRRTAVQALAQGWPDEAHPHLAHRTRHHRHRRHRPAETAVQALAQGWPDEAHPHPAHRPRHHRRQLRRPGGRGAGPRPGLARPGHPHPAHRPRHHRHQQSGPANRGAGPRPGLASANLAGCLEHSGVLTRSVGARHTQQPCQPQLPTGGAGRAESVLVGGVRAAEQAEHVVVGASATCVLRSYCVCAAFRPCACCVVGVIAGCDTVCAVMVEVLWGRARGEHAVRTRRSIGSATVDATARVSRYPAHRSDGVGGYGATATGAGAQCVVECSRPSGL